MTRAEAVLAMARALWPCWLLLAVAVAGLLNERREGHR
jgi:hypothetical protein